MVTRRRSTPESGNYVPQFDQEVENRLKALEEKSHTPCGSGNQNVSELEERIKSLETKFDTLVKVLKKSPKLNISKLSDYTL